MKKIYSEDPETDIWKELLKYTYKDNVSKYLKRLGTDDELNSIVGAFHQAYEYFKSAKDASSHIAPLLLYYGATNLLYGAVYLKNGKKPNVCNHGMDINVNDNNNMIGDTIITFRNNNNGSVHIYAREFGYNKDLTKYSEWTLKEFLDSIAEICDDYNNCYEQSFSKVLLLDVYQTSTGTVERVYANDNKEKIQNLFNLIDGFKDSYLEPLIYSDSISKTDFFLLRRKLSSKPISELSFNGQPYIKAGHKKGNEIITLPTIINMYIVLFFLASLCRYYPEKWTPFLLDDTTGEKLLIEKFIYYSRRMIPNYVLNYINNDYIQYTSAKYDEKNTIKYLGEHEIKELIEEKVNEIEIRNKTNQFLRQKRGG